MRTPLLLSSLIALGVLPPLPEPRTTNKQAMAGKTFFDLDREAEIEAIVARVGEVWPQFLRPGAPGRVGAAKHLHRVGWRADMSVEEAWARIEAEHLRAGTVQVMSSGEGPHFGAAYAREVATREHAKPRMGKSPSDAAGGVLLPESTKVDRNRQAQREARKVRKAAKARRGW